MANMPVGRHWPNSLNLANKISQAEAAKLLNVGESTIRAFGEIERKAPAEAKAIERGEKTIGEVKRELTYNLAQM